MEFEWCIGKQVGERAKSIIEHANNGLAYFIMDQGRQGPQAYCLYAFRRPLDGPTPDHLSVADASLIRKLNDRWDARHGVDKKPQQQISPASQQRILEIKETVLKRVKRASTPAPVDLGGMQA
jgi:hypothetical protein